MSAPGRCRAVAVSTAVTVPTPGIVIKSFVAWLARAAASNW